MKEKERLRPINLLISYVEQNDDIDPIFAYSPVFKLLFNQCVMTIMQNVWRSAPFLY